MIYITERRKVFMIIYMKDFKFTIEINPDELLDTEIIDNEGAMETKVHRKTTKLPFHSTPNIPKKYTRNNTMHTDLYRAKRSAQNLDNELVIIKKNYLAADYPHKFITSVINTFIENENKKQEEYLISQNFFEIPKPVILIEIIEIASKQFIKKFNYFINYKFDVRIEQLARKIRTLFQLKDK